MCHAEVGFTVQTVIIAALVQVGLAARTVTTALHLAAGSAAAMSKLC